MPAFSCKPISLCLTLVFLSLWVFVSACKPGNTGTLAPGQYPPKITLKRLDGTGAVSLHELKGKLVLLSFWASWCAPCLAELKEFKRLHDALHSKGLEIVTIGSDDTKANLQKVVDQLDITFTVLHDEAGLVKMRYGVTGFPETFIVKPDGRLVLFSDPGSGGLTLVVKGERSWASPVYQRALQQYLPRLQ